MLYLKEVRIFLSVQPAFTCSSVSIVNFEHVIASWVEWKK